MRVLCESRQVDDAQLTRFFDLAFDFACERKVSDLVDTARVLAAIDAGAQPTRVTRFLERFVQPARQRLIARAKSSQLELSVWLPEATRDVLAAFLGRPAPIPRKLIDEVVASERVRESVRAMMQESISSVIEKAFAATPGGGKGLRGVIGFGARAAGAASRGLFGGLGDELQRQLEDRLRDFVDGGVQLVQTRLAQKLASEDTARSLGARGKAAFLQLLQQTEAAAGKFFEQGPYALLDGLWPVVVAHNLQRAEVRAALTAEIEATLAELSTQPVGALLDELGVRELVRATLHERAVPLARAFVASPQFAAWTKSL